MVKYNYVWFLCGGTIANEAIFKNKGKIICDAECLHYTVFPSELKFLIINIQSYNLLSLDLVSVIVS